MQEVTDSNSVVPTKRTPVSLVVTGVLFFVRQKDKRSFVG